MLLLSAKEGQVAQNVQIKFNTAIANSGKVSAAYVKALNEQSTALSNLTGSDDEAITSTQTMLTTMGLTGAQILKITPLIMAAATATGRDLESVTLAVGRATQGSATSLGKIGIIIPKVSKASKSAALTALEHEKAVLLNNEAQAKAHAILSKSDKALFAHKKAVIDAAISQQKLTDAQKTGVTATSSYDNVLNVLSSRYKGVNEALSDQLDTHLKAFNERLQDIRENAGAKLLPALIRIVDTVRDRVIPAFGQFIDQILPPAIAGLDQLAGFLEGGGATSAIESFLNTAKAVMPVIRQSAEITGTVIKTAVDLFRSLPPEIQALAVAGLAINKLTGGLVTNIAGGLISAVISSFKGLMNVNAAVVNVNGAVTGGIGAAATGLGEVAAGTVAVAGLSTAAALTIAATALIAGLIGAVNSPLWVRNSAINTKNEDAGLTQPERAAQTYYNATAADQAEMRKHLAFLPSIADYLSGNAKIAKGTASDPVHIVSPEMLKALDDRNAEAKPRAAAVAAIAHAAVLADRKARGIKDTGPSTSLAPRLNFLAGSHSGAKDVAVAAALASGFEQGVTPLWKEGTDGIKTAIKALQADAKTLGPKDAKTIGGYIDRMKAELTRRTDAVANAAKTAGRDMSNAIKDKDLNLDLTVRNSTYFNGRLVDASMNRFASSSGFTTHHAGTGGA